jgi:phage shock protein C
VGVALASLIGAPFPIIAYFLVGWIADDKPGTLYDADPEDKQFWQKTRAAPGRSIREVRSSFRDIDRRLRDIELQYTSPNHRLAREIDDLRG